MDLYPENYALPLQVDEDVHKAIEHYKLVLGIDRRVLRAIYKHIFGAIPKGFHVDHINRNPLDNRRENLQIVTPSQNMRNKGAINHEAEPVCYLDLGQAALREE